MQPITLLTMAAAASALRFAKRTESNSDFSLTMRIGAGADAPLVSLNAVQNGTNEELLLVGEYTSAIPGSPAFLTGESPNAALSVLYNDVAYGVSVADTGDIHGIAILVGAEAGYEEYKFSVGGSDNSVSHQLTSAAQEWLACNRTVNGVVKPVLAWGSYFNNGSYVDGCYATEVYANCNVLGSTFTCSPTSYAA